MFYALIFVLTIGVGYVIIKSFIDLRVQTPNKQRKHKSLKHVIMRFFIDLFYKYGHSYILINVRSLQKDFHLYRDLENDYDNQFKAIVYNKLNNHYQLYCKKHNDYDMSYKQFLELNSKLVAEIKQSIRDDINLEKHYNDNYNCLKESAKLLDAIDTFIEEDEYNLDL